MTIRLALTLLAGMTVAVPGTAMARPTLSITVEAPSDVEPSLVDRILEEAAAIWATAGIRLDWERARPSDARDPARLTVTIDNAPVDPSERQGPLGWIPFTAAGPEPVIHLSRSMAEILCHQWPTIEDRTSAGHQRLIGRALGRALSHELGHYLLQSRLHTAHGLMRAHWPSDELFALDRSGFELTAEQREAVDVHGSH